MPDDDIFDAFPEAPITHDNVDLYRARRQQRLVVKRCHDCGAFHEPPRSFCPACLSADVRGEPVSGRGTVALFSRVHAGPAVDGIDYRAGHPIAVVELAEQAGLRMAGQFVTPDARDARIGEPVELVWLSRHGGPTPAFTPRTEGN